MIQTVDKDRPPLPDVMLPFDPVLFQCFWLLLNHKAQHFSILRAVSPGHDYNASVSSRSWDFQIKRERHPMNDFWDVRSLWDRCEWELKSAHKRSRQLFGFISIYTIFFYSNRATLNVPSRIPSMIRSPLGFKVLKMNAADGTLTKCLVYKVTYFFFCLCLERLYQPTVWHRLIFPLMSMSRPTNCQDSILFRKAKNMVVLKYCSKTKLYSQYTFNGVSQGNGLDWTWYIQDALS